MKMKKVLSLLLVICLMGLSLSACSDNSSNGTTDSTATTSQGADTDNTPTEVTTLSVYAINTNSPGVHNDYLAEYMKSNLGIELEWASASNDHLLALMATGELPDIVEFERVGQFKDAYDAGLLMKLDDYLAEDGTNLTANAQMSLDYYKDEIGTDGYYGVGANLSPAVFTGDLNWAVALRWDLYKEIGTPELESLFDLPELLAEMQAIEPTNANGQTVYGLSLWPDWDGNAHFQALDILSFYGREVITDTYAQYNSVTGETVGLLTEDSMYKEALKLFYDLNQMGLLDPESVSQQYANAKGKYADGRAIAAFHEWVSSGYNTAEGNEEAGKGFVGIYPTDSQVFIEPSYSVGNYTFAISAATEHPEVAMDFLDFWYSTECAYLMYSGVEGEHYEIVDGTPVLTDAGWDRVKNPDPNNSTEKYTAVPGLGSGFVDPETGVSVGRQYWDDYKEREEADRSLVEQDFLTTMGYERSGTEALNIPDNYSIRMSLGLLPVITDDVKSINSQIAPIVKENSWKMVFAADEAEFEALWEDMVTKAEGLGIEQSYAAGEAAIEVLKENESKYSAPVIVNFND